MLFQEEDYNHILSLKDIPSIGGYIKETVYGRDLEIVRARRMEEIKREGQRSVERWFPLELEILDSTFNHNLTRTLRILWDGLPHGAQGLIRPVFAIYEAYNIKTILRGIDGGVEPKELYPILLPVGRLDEYLMQELLQHRDVKSVLEMLITLGFGYIHPVYEQLDEYKRTHSLFPLETALDRSIYPYILQSLPSKGSESRFVTGIVRERIDISNILMIFRLVRAGMPSPSVLDYFIPCGRRLDEDAFSSILSRDYGTLSEVVDVMRVYIKDRRWIGVVESCSSEPLPVMDDRLGWFVEEDMRRQAVLQPLSLAVPLHYIMKKHREVRKLRLISRAKAFSIPIDDVKRFVR